MARLPWTKFQDFYLRLGFLKVLVAILDPSRRSVASDTVTRRLQQLLFVPAESHGALWRIVQERYPWFVYVARKKSGPGPTLAEALLLLGDCPSQLYAVTQKTAYKVLDWGRDLGLTAAGNQLSEKGLLLRAQGTDDVSDFLRGNTLAWNPFILSDRERLFLLFHLCEVDKLTIDVLDEIARPGVEETIESAAAAAMICRAFFHVLDEAEPTIPPADLPAFRRGRELASVIAKELQLTDLIKSRHWIAQTRPPIRSPIPTRHPKKQSRRTTKNADHQTIPRFEQLVDLGFLRKPMLQAATSQETWQARRRWRYERLPSCGAWSSERQKSLSGSGPWEWRGFAITALTSGLAGLTYDARSFGPEVIGKFFWGAYEKVRRPVGHTPFHSIAVVAMLDATLSGYAIEVQDFHAMMLKIKTNGLLQDNVFFASGNEISRMFLVVRSGFLEGLQQIVEQLQE